MPEIYDGSTSRYLLPDSHPHVKHLCARFSFGFSSCTGCQFHLASSSLDQLDAISRIVQLRSSQSVAMEGLPGSEAAFEEISPQSMGTTSPIVLPTPRAPPRLDTTNQAEVPVEREEPVPVEPHTMQMPKELLKALLDEATTPQPLTLQHCWLHLPPICPQYQRCVVCVDKLGLSLRPLGRSKYPADELHRISGLKILHTESLNFPLSSILNVEEVAGQITEQVMEKPAETQTWRTHFGRKHFLPLARLVFSRSFQAGSVGQKQKPCPEAADQLPAAAAYFVNVKIRAGITGKIPGQDSRRNRPKEPHVFCMGGGGKKFFGFTVSQLRSRGQCFFKVSSTLKKHRIRIGIWRQFFGLGPLKLDESSPLGWSILLAALWSEERIPPCMRMRDSRMFLSMGGVQVS